MIQRFAEGDAGEFFSRSCRAVREANESAAVAVSYYVERTATPLSLGPSRTSLVKASPPGYYQNAHPLSRWKLLDNATVAVMMSSDDDSYTAKSSRKRLLAHGA